jgi:type IV pilus assembly protein PilN
VIRINLLPIREARRKAGARQQMVLMAASAAGAVLLCIGAQTWVHSEISATQRRIQALQVQLAQYKPQQDQVAQFKAKKAEIEQKLRVIEKLEHSRSGPVHIMDELASRIPERVWLTDLNADNGQIELTGMSLDNELVALFLTGLNDSPYFANVELEETELKQMDELKLNTFKIRASLESPEDPTDAKPAAAIGAPGAPGAARTTTPSRAPAPAAGRKL